MLSVFRNQDFQLTVYGSWSRPLFLAQEVGTILGMTNIHASIRNMPSEYKGHKKLLTPGGEQEMTCITEPGLYYIAMRSNKENAIPFQKWVCESVLPSLRKTGEYSIAKTVRERTTFTIQSEYDLHNKVVHFMKQRYPEAIYSATLGENQDTDDKRMRSCMMGYQAGSPDLLIHSLHKKYRGFALEMKTPTGLGVLADQQKKMLKNYEINGFKILVSNCYDEILYELIHYMAETRVQCPCCRRRFKTAQSLEQHTRGFHKII